MQYSLQTNCVGGGPISGIMEIPPGTKGGNVGGGAMGLAGVPGLAGAGAGAAG